MFDKFLLWCGILSSLLYVAINIIVPLHWEEYDIASQTVSELSAVGAPTRLLWILLSAPYTLLVAAFGWGVARASYQSKRLRISGLFLMIYGLLGIAWPFPPMHLREVLAIGGGTVSDILHIVLACLTVVLMLLSIGFAAGALKAGFRAYSTGTMIVLSIFGTLTALDSPGMEANLPTPFLGIWERISIGAFLLWIVVLAIMLLKQHLKKATVDPNGLQPLCSTKSQSVSGERKGVKEVSPL